MTPAEVALGAAGILLNTFLALVALVYSRRDKGSQDREDLRKAIDAVAKDLHDHQLAYEKRVGRFVERSELDRWDDCFDVLTASIARLREILAAQRGRADEVAHPRRAPKGGGDLDEP